jgi:hypothetical protein
MQVIAMMRKQSKMYAAGGKLEMVKNKDGEEVPFFAADGEGKMMAGGLTPPKTKGYFKGGKVMEGAYGSLTGTPVPYSPKPGGGRGRGGKRRGGKG